MCHCRSSDAIPGDASLQQLAILEPEKVVLEPAESVAVDLYGIEKSQGWNTRQLAEHM